MINFGYCTFQGCRSLAALDLDGVGWIEGVFNLVGSFRQDPRRV